MNLKLNFLLNNWLTLAALGQALGLVAGVINAIGLVIVFAGLIGTAVSAMGERNVSGIKTNLAISAIGGCAWLLAQAMFAAGGGAPNITMQNI